MRVAVILTIICLKYSIRCEYVDNYVISDPELVPRYDTIIFRDLIDVMNEIDESLNNGYDYNYNFYNDSEGDDNIEDLLSEYQRFLDKAQSQKIEVEKNRHRNKFSKIEQDELKKDSNKIHHYNYYSNTLKSFPKSFSNSFPFSSDIFTLIKNKVLNNWPKSAVKITSPLYSPEYPNALNSLNGYNNKIIQNPRYSMDTTDDLAEDKMQVNIKVDVKFPKNWQPPRNVLYKNIQDYGKPAEFLLRDSINMPITYSNSVPNIVSFKPHIHQNEYEPTKKIKLLKKKNRSNKAGRRHKKKKIITIHNFSFDTIPENNVTQKNETSVRDCKDNSTINNNCTLLQNNNSTDIIQTSKINSSMALSTTETNLDKTDNSTESIYLIFNISSTFDNITEDSQKIENSIEAFEKSNVEPSTIRHKREINKKAIKISSVYDELLYWPTNLSKNAVEISKNITSLILEIERKKAKLNITSDVMRNNHTMALERAIFGEIDWDDMDSVVPEFISFVGKYLRGILTFCSETICHSMKCVEKICLHRVCQPQERFNIKGHCTGKDNNDSVAALESIMDLPSNIGLEIVDILETKLRGKMFGKATLCITPKCVTFVASKKSFIKSKCPFKELTSTGHCPNIKTM